MNICPRFLPDCQCQRVMKYTDKKSNSSMVPHCALECLGDCSDLSTETEHKVYLKNMEMEVYNRMRILFCQNKHLPVLFL